MHRGPVYRLVRSRGVETGIGYWHRLSKLTRPRCCTPVSIDARWLKLSWSHWWYSDHNDVDICVCNSLLSELSHFTTKTRGHTKRWRDDGATGGYQLTRHTVISSHGHVVTRLSRHRSTRHTRVSSHSQLVTSEHITKPPVPVVIICRPSGDTQKQCSTQTA